MKLTGKIKDRKPVIYNRAQMDEFFASLDEGEWFEISLSKKRKKGSHQTHKYWRGVLVPLFRQLFNGFGNDFTSEQTHEILKHKFMIKDVIDNEGVVIGQYAPSSAEWTQEEWGIVIEKAIAW